MKKVISLLVICLAVLCLFSSCGMFETKPLEATYRHYGHITYQDPVKGGIRAERSLLSLYPNGNYTIDLIGSGTWKRDESDSNKIILTASDPKVFTRMELEYDPKFYELNEIRTETTNPKFEIEGWFKYTAPL